MVPLSVVREDPDSKQVVGGARSCLGLGVLKTLNEAHPPLAATCRIRVPASVTAPSSNPKAQNTS